MKPKTVKRLRLSKFGEKSKKKASPFEHINSCATTYSIKKTFKKAKRIKRPRL